MLVRINFKVSAEYGGMFGGFDACALPRNEWQVIKAKSRSKTGASPTCTPNDGFAIVMHQAFLEEINDLFIREIKTL